MNNEELAAQVSALHIQPGTVVVLSLNLDADNFEAAKAMAEQLRMAIPEENKLLVLQRPAEIQALDEAQMRELGWVRWEKVEPLIGCAELLADNLRRDAENVSDDMEAAGMERHADNIDALVRQVKGTQPELPL